MRRISTTTIILIGLALIWLASAVLLQCIAEGRVHCHTFLEWSTECTPFHGLLFFAPVAGLLLFKRIRRGYLAITKKIRQFIIVYQFIKLQKN